MRRRTIIVVFSLIFSTLLLWGLFYMLGHYLSYQSWSSIFGRGLSYHKKSIFLQNTVKTRFSNFIFSPLEAHMRRYGMVCIEDSIKGIPVDLKYSTTDNFILSDLYGTLDKAMAHPFLVSRLRRARALLKIRRPDLDFIILDAARPKSIQYDLWEKLKEHPDRKNYVSNPSNGSMHNLGLAIDLSLIDTSGNPLDMGSRYDYFGEEAHITQESLLVKKLLITEEALENRLLLREIMIISGFKTIYSEWWHFYLDNRDISPQPLMIP